MGILSDGLGRRKVILNCAVFYIIVSFLCAVSINPNMLLICRFFQGISIAGLGVINRAIATDLFTGLPFIKAMSYIAISWSLGPILGPFIGSYFQW